MAGEGIEKEESVEKIRVDVELVNESPQSYYNHKYRPVPGGCRIEREREAACTVGAPATDSSGNSYLLSAAHCWEGEDAGESEGYQPSSGRSSVIATRNSSKWKLDSSSGDEWDACALDVTGVNTSHQFASNSGDNSYERGIAGVLSKEWIEDNDESDEIHKRGRTTGSSSGNITLTGDVTYRTDADSDDGDSGGPHYYINRRGNALITGIHKSGSNTGARACYAELIENEFDVYI
ncbi:hypothetical protein AB7C87_22005 [Natrarchaeobius sp. A-rgal3]|uniref:hypothetical protein n=1 Tax=Natrarchaeobius versutus TaxID=1679078 RepID=UPI00350E9B64